jgi:putative glutamine amidotransferase
MRRFIPYLIVSLLILVNVGVDCQVRIAVSKTAGTYERWLQKADPDVVILNMYGHSIDSALKILSTCSGLLLTGGEDVNPALYGKVNELSKCEEIDNYRDSLEFALIKSAIAMKMPLFGICRGAQVLNVALGGTLLTDIPTDVGTSESHRSSVDDKGSPHLVIIDKNSILYRVTGILRDTVNSYHHQSIDKVAPGYKVTARSKNGVAEALEPISSEGKPFIMAVQFHPEKPTLKSALSGPLAENFIKQAKSYRITTR